MAPGRSPTWNKQSNAIPKQALSHRWNGSAATCQTVLGIEERAVFEFSWTEDDFIAALRQRNCIGMVWPSADDRVGSGS